MCAYQILNFSHTRSVKKLILTFDQFSRIARIIPQVCMVKWYSSTHEKSISGS